MSTKSSKRQRSSTSTCGARPAAAAVEPLSTRRCHGSASANSHCTTNGPAGAVRWSTARATDVKSSSIDAGSRGGAPFGGPMKPARSIARPYSARSAAVISSGNTDGPGSDSSGSPAERSLASNERAPSV
jgi:hypothetical protein